MYNININIKIGDSNVWVLKSRKEQTFFNKEKN